MEKNIIVIDVSPLIELEYTGIANVVYEFSKRSLLDKWESIDIRYMILERLVSPDDVLKCVTERSGISIRKKFDEDFKFCHYKSLKEFASSSFITGIFFNKKPSVRVFDCDILFVHDFSVLITPECHSEETLRYQKNDLVKSIDNTNYFICNSKSTRYDLIDIFDVPEMLSEVVYLGPTVNLHNVNVEKWDFQVDGSVYFLILGTIEPRKNVELIFQWLHNNRFNLKDYKFVFAGREGWGKTFDDYVSHYNIHDLVDNGIVIYLGFVNEATKKSLLSDATALMYLSIFEGFGLPVLEALQMGTPVILSCSSSLPEVAGEAGYYFDPLSISSFNRAFESFIRDCNQLGIEVLKDRTVLRSSEFDSDEMYYRIKNVLMNSKEIKYKSDLAKGIDFTNNKYPFYVKSTSGISKCEGWGRWSDSRLGNIKISFKYALPANFILRAKVKAIGPQINNLLIVKIGGKQSEVIVGESFKQYEFEFFDIKDCYEIEFIPKHTTKGDVINSASADPRVLSIGFRELKLVCN